MQNNPEQKFARDIGLFGLTMISIGSIIGSGWLFGSYLAAQLAGPAAILCWIIGGVAIMLIALTISELGSAFPKAGGMVRYAEYSHGSLAGFMSGWANWLSIVAVIPSEAEGSIQYLSSWKFEWANNLFHPVTHSLTGTGIAASVVLMLVYFFINYWTIKFFIRFISVITVFKIIVPILTAITILYSGFHVSNFTSVGGTFMPYGLPSVLTAVVTCGIVFSFNGFQSVATLAGEAKRAHINVPLAMLGGIAMTMILYLALQVAFIGAISPVALLQAGWHGIQFHSPLAELALLYQLNFIAILLYIDSFVSPSGTGIIYVATSSRMLYALSRNKYMPSFLQVLNPQTKSPRYAVLGTLVVSFIFMFLFHGWAHIVGVISVATIIAFIPGPIALGGLRRVAPDAPRIFKLPFAKVVSPAAFAVISLLLYWAKWPLNGEMIELLLCTLVVYFYYQHKQGWPNFAKQLNAAWWLIVYFIGMILIAKFGGQEFGGTGAMSALTANIITVVFAILIYWWAVRTAWRTPALEEALADPEVSDLTAELGPAINH